jgi:hypothetical protein
MRDNHFKEKILKSIPTVVIHEKEHPVTRASAKFWHAGRCILNPTYRSKIQLTQHQSCFPDFQFQHQLIPEIHSDIPSFR